MKPGEKCGLVQRSGEGNDVVYNAFLSTRYRDEIDDLWIRFPQRRHIEQFFNAYQDLGWKRAGIVNFNIRFGQMSMALPAQAVCDQFRKRLGDPFASWDSRHFASAIFQGIDGDIRAADTTIIVTLYNPPVPDLLKENYENLPNILEHENIDPRIPWLFDYKLDSVRYGGQLPVPIPSRFFRRRNRGHRVSLPPSAGIATGSQRGQPIIHVHPVCPIIWY